MTLNDIAEIYRAALPDDGNLFLYDMTAADHVGIPAYSAVYLPGPLGGGDGFGETHAAAQVGAIGELQERVQSRRVVPTLPTERGSYRDLVTTYGENAVLDPVRLNLTAGSEYRVDMPRLWTPMQQYPSGEKWVLLEAVASHSAALPEDYQPLLLPISNGLGAGLDTARALNHAVFELLQRDGNSVNYRALDQGKTIQLADVPAEAADVWARFDEANIHLSVKLAATDFGLVNLYINGYGPDDDHPQIKLAAGGMACAFDRTTALRKALLEFAGSRARLASEHGDLSWTQKVFPRNYLDIYRSHLDLASQETRALESMLSWLDLSPTQLRSKLAPIFQTCERVDWKSLPSAPELAQASQRDQLDEISKRLAPLEILYSEQATPRAQDHGVRAVKAVVPTLEVETASYARIGERNLRRLLDRESPLVRVGDEPTDNNGWREIHLTEAAREEFGGRGWLHVARLNAIVDELYSLYREPSHHAAAFVRAGLL